MLQILSNHQSPLIIPFVACSGPVRTVFDRWSLYKMLLIATRCASEGNAEGSLALRARSHGNDPQCK